MTPDLVAQLAAMVLITVFIAWFVMFLTLVFERDDQAVPEVVDIRCWPLAPIASHTIPARGPAPMPTWRLADHRPAQKPAR